MVKSALNTSAVSVNARRRGGVQNAAKRAAAQQYKFAGAQKTLQRSAAQLNKSAANAAGSQSNAGQQSGVATAGAGDKQTYTRKWLEENDKDKKAFDEEVLASTFGTENLQKLIAACKQATEAEVAESNRLLSDDYVYSVQITSHRAPHVPMHLSRILLPNSLETADSDICLFVKDLKRGRKLDYEPTVKHYEALLRAKKVIDGGRHITVIPVNQLYNEFATFELRRKLTYLYDRFLVDKSVAAHVNGFLGQKLLSKGCSAIPVDMGADDLATEVETALRKVFYKHINNGITQNVQVGRHSMSDAAVAANVQELVAQLAVIHPGGTKNVYKLHLKPNVNVSVAVPLYVDLAKPTLATPTEAGPRAKTLEATAETAATTLENFEINKAGAVVAKPKLAKQLAAADASADAAADEEADQDEDMEATAAAESTSVAPAPVPKPVPAPVPAVQQQQPKKQKQQQQQQAAQAAVPAIAEEQLNNFLLKNLKKLVPQLQQQLPKQQQQQAGGRVQKNQQQNNQGQQQQQLQQQPKQQRQQNNQQQNQMLHQQNNQQQMQPQQQRQQRQNNSNNNQMQQQQGGYNNQQQQPMQRQQNNNMGGGNRRNQNNNSGGGNLSGGFQSNMGGGLGGGYGNQQQQMQRGGNLGGGNNLNNMNQNYQQQNQRQMGAIGGGLGGGNRAGGFQNQSGGFGGNLGGGNGGNWGNASGGNNNSPWGQRNQF